MQRKRVIGLTGNIACGKTAVARLLTALGIPVIDADQVSRDVTSPGGPGYAEIIANFGNAILTPTGELDRAALRKKVFEDPDLRKKIEAILHPLIAKRSHELLEAELAKGAPFVVYDAALLVETGRHRDFDGLLVVTCDPTAQKSRLLARDEDLDEKSADQMIAAQMAQAQKAAEANWVIDNSGTPEELREKVREWTELVGKN